VAEPRILVLVLNYNSGDDLAACLRSLRETTYPKTEIVVLDNGSKDGSLEEVRRLGVEVHEYGENLGYCAAYNRAFKMYSDRADYYLLSNADLVIPPPTIERMVGAAASDATVGFVGPLQRHEDTKEVRSAGIRWRCGHLPVHVTTPDLPYDAIEGAFVLIRKEVVERVGGLDEALALNLEDVDWQSRARREGFRPLLVTDAEIFHRRPGAIRRHTGAYYQTRNVCILTARYCDRRALAVVRSRLYLEGVAGTLLGRPRAPYVLEGLRDFQHGVIGMKHFA
jgi:GT2 family glycosyltransferase